MSNRNLYTDHVKEYQRLKVRSVDVSNEFSVNGVPISDLQNKGISAGIIDGFTPLDLYITPSIPTGRVYLRETNSPTAKMTEYTIPALLAQSISNGNNYFYVDYNSGNPVIKVTTTLTLINGNTSLMLYSVYRDGSYVTATKRFQYASNSSKLTQDFLVSYFENVRSSGLILTGLSRYPIVSSGIAWNTINEQTIQGKNCSTGDTFTSYYQTSPNVFAKLLSNYEIDNLNYNDITSGLVPLSPYNYAVHDFYMTMTGHLVSAYGTADFGLVALAKEANRFEIPPALAENSVYIGRMIINMGGTTYLFVLSAFTDTFGGSFRTTADHDALYNLTTGDPHPMYSIGIGRSGGQTLIGGTSSGDNLVLQTTSNGTKGEYQFSDLSNADTVAIIGSNKNLESGVVGSSLQLTGSSLNTIQDIRTTDSPTFDGLNVTSIDITNPPALGGLNISTTDTCKAIHLDQVDNDSDPIYMEFSKNSGSNVVGQIGTLGTTDLQILSSSVGGAIKLGVDANISSAPTSFLRIDKNYAQFNNLNIDMTSPYLLKYGIGTPNRLLYLNSSKDMISTNLHDWLSSSTGNISISSDGAGGANINCISSIDIIAGTNINITGGSPKTINNTNIQNTNITDNVTFNYVTASRVYTNNMYEIGTAGITMDTGFYVRDYGVSIGCEASSDAYRDNDRRLTILGNTGNQVLCPSMGFNFSNDVRSGLYFHCLAHDTQEIMFDCYHDNSATILSSSVNSNYIISHTTNKLKFQYESGITVGNACTMTTAIDFDTTGNVNIPTSLTTDKVILSGTNETLEGTAGTINLKTADIIDIIPKDNARFRVQGNVTTGNCLVDFVRADPTKQIQIRLGSVTAGNKWLLGRMIGSSDSLSIYNYGNSVNTVTYSYLNDSATFVGNVFTPRINCGATTNPANSKLVVTGTSSNYSTGPNQFFVGSADVYPLMSFVPYAHNNVSLLMDCYCSASTLKSSNATSCWRILKNSDLYFDYNTGTASGSDIGSWTNAMRITTAGLVQMPLVPTNNIGAGQTDVEITAGGFLGYNGSLKIMKTNINYNPPNIDNIYKIPIISFNYRKKLKEGLTPDCYSDTEYDDVQAYGALAGQMEKLFPEVCCYRDSDRKELHGINWKNLIPVIIKTLQNQKNEINELKEANEKYKLNKKENIAMSDNINILLSENTTHKLMLNSQQITISNLQIQLNDILKRIGSVKVEI